MPAFRLQDATRDLLELPGRGVALSLLDFGGAGPLAVLSHANGFCAALQQPLAERLCTRFRVVAFDSRGHGESTVPHSPGAWEWREFALDWLVLVDLLCEKMSVARVELGVGHSFGGSALLSAAVHRPDRFGAVAVIDPVLLAPPRERPAPSPGDPGNTMAVAARRRTAVFPSREAVRGSWSRRGVFSDWHPDVLELYLREGFRERADGSVELRCAPEVEAAIYEAGPRFDLLEELPALRVPTLWLHAARGNFPLALAERARASAPCIEIVSLDAGHLMPMVSPAEVASRVLAWSTSEGAAATRSAP
jgi:pimeloyl-ACP methyl ester carboxylesterase